MPYDSAKSVGSEATTSGALRVLYVRPREGVFLREAWACAMTSIKCWS